MALAFNFLSVSVGRYLSNMYALFFFVSQLASIFFRKLDEVDHDFYFYPNVCLNIPSFLLFSFCTCDQPLLSSYVNVNVTCTRIGSL